MQRLVLDCSLSFGVFSSSRKLVSKAISTLKLSSIKSLQVQPPLPNLLRSTAGACQTAARRGVRRRFRGDGQLTPINSLRRPTVSASCSPALARKILDPTTRKALDPTTRKMSDPPPSSPPDQDAAISTLSNKVTRECPQTALTSHLGERRHQPDGGADPGHPA